MSSFYSSNEIKHKRFILNDKLREINQYNQQEVLDDMIAQEMGLETQATDLGRLATRIVNRVATEIIPKTLNIQDQVETSKQLTPIQMLVDSIKKGTLSQLFNKITSLPNEGLNATQRAIRDTLSNPTTKQALNDDIISNLDKGEEAIANSLIESMGGAENKVISLNMIKLAIEDIISKEGNKEITTRKQKKRKKSKQKSKANLEAFKRLNK